MTTNVNLFICDRNTGHITLGYISGHFIVLLDFFIIFMAGIIFIAVF